METSAAVLRKMVGPGFSHVDRAVAVLWLHEKGGGEGPLAASDLAGEIEAAGYAKQNATRLAKQLDRDPRILRRNRKYRLNVEALEDVDTQLAHLLGPQPPPPSDSILPLELFFDTRGYLERVVRQANASYDAALYDCCAVMLRRIAETLIIEVYEGQARANEIKGPDGNFLFLSGLVARISNDKSVALSRNTAKALDDFKRLGDLSAHNRRYNAVRDDIDRVRDGFRATSQELLVLAGMR